MHVTFIKIGEIDTLKEHFEADVLIRSKWREPDLDTAKVCVDVYVVYGYIRWNGGNLT